MSANHVLHPAQFGRKHGKRPEHRRDGHGHAQHEDVAQKAAHVVRSAVRGRR